MFSLDLRMMIELKILQNFDYFCVFLICKYVLETLLRVLHKNLCIKACKKYFFLF